MRYLLAALALLAVACGSDDDGSTSEPTTSAVSSPTTVATLPAPTVVTLDEKSSEFWELRGYGALRLAPESIHGTSPQLDDETLVREWSGFLTGTLLVDFFTYEPDVELCADGTVILHGSLLAKNDIEFSWRVETPDESIEPYAVDGNAVTLVLKEGFNTLRLAYGATQGTVVLATTGLHKDELSPAGELLAQRKSRTRWAATRSLDCD